MAAAYAKNPKDIATVFKLAQKWDRPLRRCEVLADVQGAHRRRSRRQAGDDRLPKEKVSYTELAEFNIGQSAIRSRPPVPAPLQAFIKKYKDGIIVKDAYSRLAQGYYGRTAPKDEAIKFFDEYTTRFSDDPQVLSAYVRRILQDKDNLDKGLESPRRRSIWPRAERKANAPAPRSSLHPEGRQGESRRRCRGDLEGRRRRIPPAAPVKPNRAGLLSGPGRHIRPKRSPELRRGRQNGSRPRGFGPEYLKKNMENGRALTAYVTFWLGQGKNLESALESAKKAVALTPDAYTGWNNLSQANLKLKKYDDALKAARKGLRDRARPAAPDQGQYQEIDRTDQGRGAGEEVTIVRPGAVRRVGEARRTVPFFMSRY